MRQIQLDTDCEGPLALNDNAFELCRDFLKPNGDRFFKQVSRYDDYLADVEKRPGYKAGDTLKLVLPFLRAAGLTNKKLADFSRRTIILVPGVKEAYKFLRYVVEDIFMISTSYQQYPETVGKELGIPRKNIFSTAVNLNKYRLCSCEADELRRLRDIIIKRPFIELPDGAKSIFDLPEPSQQTIRLLDEIFFKVIPAMKIGNAIYRSVNPVGGIAKAQAVQEAAARTGISLSDTIYVGDSITDVQAFEAVSKGEGLAVSFNGNRYAIEAAEVAIAADNAWPVALVVAVFAKWGKKAVLKMIKLNSQPRDLSHLGLSDQQGKELSRALKEVKFRLFAIEDDQEAAKKASAFYRDKLRGATIAALG